MTNKFKISLTVQKRILLHLLEYINNEDGFEVDNNIIQQGIANSLGIRLEHVSRSVNRLIKDKQVYYKSIHIKGIPRRRKAYFLTTKGIEHSKEIKKWFENKIIFVRTPDNDIQKIKFYQLKKILNFKIKPMEIFNYMSNDGIIDLKQFSLDKTHVINVQKSENDYPLIFYPSNYIVSHSIPKIKDFYGRINELNQLKTWIDDKKLYRFIIIHGVAGIGKTTLASKLSEDYKSKKHLFWHTLNKWDTIRSTLSELAEFLSEIGDDFLKSYINYNKQLDLEKVLNSLKKKLKKINALFVFDDFHKVNNDLRDFFASLIEIIEKLSNTKFIILTRYNIPFYDQQKVLVRNSVAELEIEGLDFASSVEILRKKHLPKARYKGIYDITAGHPLLLEVIDSDLKTRRYIFEEIFSKLSKDEKTIMERLSIFRAPIPYDAFFVDEQVQPESIENLVQKLIIRQISNELYNTHEFIKEFFYKRLSPQNKQQYHEFGGEFYMKQKSPIDLIEALYHYIKSQKYENVIDLALRNAQKIIEHGLSERFLTVLEELPEDEVVLPQWTETLMLKARLCFIIGDWDKSLRHYHQAVEVATGLLKEDIIAKAYCEIGHILEEKNLFKDALENFQKSLEIANIVKDKKLIAEVKRGIGRYYWRKSDYNNAEKYYKEALKALQKIDDFKLIGAIHIDLGIIYFEMEKQFQAIKYLEKALNYLERVDDKLEIARAYNNLGTICTYITENKNAIKYFKKQLKIAETIGDIRVIGYGLSNIGYCYAKSNQIVKAEDHVKRAKRIFEKINNENILFQILRTDALINQYYQEWDKAIECFNKSIKIIKKLNVPFYLSKTLIDFGLLYENKKDLKNAKKYYQKAHSVYQKMGWTIPNQLEAKLLDLNRS